MLESLRLHNFRTYLDTTFPFTTRHLLIGRNNSGKSNVCHAIRFLGATSRLDLQSAAQAAIPGAFWEMKNWSYKSNLIEFGCRCTLQFRGESHRFDYSLELLVESVDSMPFETPPTVRVNKELLVLNAPGFADAQLLVSDGHEARMLHEENHLRRKGAGSSVKAIAPADSTMLCKLWELETNRRSIWFRRYLSSWLYFNLSPAAMRTGWKPRTDQPSGLFMDLSDLATQLYQLKNMDERRYRKVIEGARIVEPDLEAINFFPAADSPVPFVALSSRNRALWIGLSDGTLKCLALAFLAELAAERAVSETAPPLFVVIEEIENGIAPGQLRRIYDLFEERSTTSQFLFTTHSPYFINFFDSSRNSVSVLRRVNERTKILSPPEPDQLDANRLMLADEYSMEIF